MLKRFIILSLLTALFSGTAVAANVANKLTEYLTAWVEIGQFSGSVLIAKEGQVLLSKGFGMADYELEVPNSAQTKFRIGSVTKQFTALAIMQLQEDGKLSVDDPIAKYLPDYPNSQFVTIRHLLNHTSGIADYTRKQDFLTAMATPTTLEDIVAGFQNLPSNFLPGEQFQYCNSGYLLLGLIIEQVSGQIYEEYLHQDILDPLALDDTGYDHNTTLLKGRAAGYIPGPDGPVNAPYIHMS